MKFMNSKKLGAFFVVLLIIIFFLAIKGELKLNTDDIYILKEPMLISSSNGSSYYMIPANTALHYQRGFAEGHQLYKIEVFVKGELAASHVDASTAHESTWLYRIEADDVGRILQEYPLSKEDLVQILKSRKMTREDLAQIVRDWNDD